VGTLSKIVIVVPCYNEERRLQAGALLPILAEPDTHLRLVDDGSSDATPRVLESIRREQPDRIVVSRLPRNQGKAEAVRTGMLDALSSGATVVGFLDADGSTPPEEMRRLIDEARKGVASVVMAARVALLGSKIRRSLPRHLLGRLFATAASTALAMEVYDTQCGAKLLRDTPSLRDALKRRFRSRWAFDVELIGRLIAPSPGVPPLAAEDFVEVPIRQWRDVRGSKLTTIAMLRAGLDLVPIAWEVHTARAAQAQRRR